MTKIAPSSIVPPRPLNCFLLFRNDKQKEIVAKCSGANHRDISKVIAKWWRDSSPDVKAYYRKKAEEEKEEHKKLYPNYKYSPKKKTGPKRVYNRKTDNDTFTSKDEENNKLMERIYESEEILKDLEDQKKAPVTVKSRPARHLFKPKARNLSTSNFDLTFKGRYSSVYSPSSFKWNNQDVNYFRSMTEIPPPRSSHSPSSVSSIGSSYSFKTLSSSSSSSICLRPDDYPSATSYDNISRIMGQEEIYSTYYPTQSTITPGSSNNKNRSNTGFGYINPVYSNSHSTPITAPYPHYSSSNRNLDYSYLTAVGPGTYDYDTEFDKVINPELLSII